MIDEQGLIDDGYADILSGNPFPVQRLEVQSRVFTEIHNLFPIKTRRHFISRGPCGFVVEIGVGQIL
ncbi:MAG: hypothetical protein ABSA10_06025 [Anaerolineales bacterium]